MESNNDQDNFIKMLKNAGIEWEFDSLFDTRFISFKITGGFGGSESSWAMAFFDEECKLKGFNHND